MDEESAPGKPAPGWVPVPTRYRFITSVDLLYSLNQANWVGMGCTEKAAYLSLFNNVIKLVPLIVEDVIKY